MKFLALLPPFVLVACGKESTYSTPKADTPSGGNASNASKPDPKPAPAGIPQKYQDMLDNGWAKIQTLGKEFEAEMVKVTATRGADKAAVNKAGETFQELNELWSEIAYAAQDESDAVMEAWAKHISSYERKVKKWVSASKALKEFSTVK